MVTADKVKAIRTKAEALLGQSFGENGDMLVGMAAHAACAHCQRDDIPEEMEQAVARLALALDNDGEGVKSITRGDTAVFYEADTTGGALAGLAPFCRLGRLKKEGT